jgi:hypothetical protein
MIFMGNPVAAHIFFHFEEGMRVTPLSISPVSKENFSSTIRGDIAFFSGCPAVRTEATITATSKEHQNNFPMISSELIFQKKGMKTILLIKKGVRIENPLSSDHLIELLLWRRFRSWVCGGSPSFMRVTTSQR